MTNGCGSICEQPGAGTSEKEDHASTRHAVQFLEHGGIGSTRFPNILLRPSLTK